MSTTFQVYPLLPIRPTFAEVVELSNARLHQYLREFEVPANYDIEVKLRNCEPDFVVPTDLNKTAVWPETQYAWFQVPPIAGGADAYFISNDAADIRDLEEEFANYEMPAERRVLVTQCLGNSYYWSFRRSMGQPAIIHLAYGMIAASFAELTDGVIESRDCAWDGQRFPATASEFFDWYFKPEKAIESDHKEWAEHCLAVIRAEANR